jgi:predicted nucleotidyltransferase
LGLQELAQLVVNQWVVSKNPNSGIINPNMGTDTRPADSSALANALFPKVRQRVLAVLFAAPDRSFYANEVIALAQSGTGAVQRELAGLSAAGLLTVSRQGNQKHYQANATAPVFAELRSLVLKTMGLADVLRTALGPLGAQIDAAFIYGSVARQQDTALSDLDVIIVSSTLAYSEVFGALEGATVTLGRKVNPTLYTPTDWAKRMGRDSAFVTRVWRGPKTWLIGSEAELHASNA